MQVTHVRRHAARLTIIATAMIVILASGEPPHAMQSQPTAPLKIGVTLHPYYSWTKNVVGTLPGYEVRSILPGEIDAGDYQPRPDDIKKLVDLDAIVVNGIGHDDFILPMIKASGNTKLVIIRPNETTPQIHVGARHRRQLAHLHLVHQRDPADLRDPEGARGAAPAGRGRAAAQRRRVRAAAAADQGARRRSSWPKPRSRASSPCTTATATCCRSSASRSPASCSRRMA